MKFNTIIFTVLAIALLSLTTCGGGSGGGGGEEEADDPATSTYTLGGNSFSATTVESGSTKTASVTDASGNVLGTAAITVNGVTLTAPDGTVMPTSTFTTALSEMPTNFATNLLAATIAAQYAGYAAACIAKDNPGCDLILDLQCNLSCCAYHDACYYVNGCNFTSWFNPLASAACQNCNQLVEYCMLGACLNVTESRTTDRCFDARCGRYFDCDAASCECTSPCVDSPTACGSGVYSNCCGNGSCEVIETSENCPADCAEGLAMNTCCYELSDCPSETASNCVPGGCCCCGYGEVCTKDGTHVCGAASISAMGGLDPEIAALLKRCEGKPKSECR